MGFNQKETNKQVKTKRNKTKQTNTSQPVTDLNYNVLLWFSSMCCEILLIILSGFLWEPYFHNSTRLPSSLIRHISEKPPKSTDPLMMMAMNPTKATVI